MTGKRLVWFTIMFSYLFFALACSGAEVQIVLSPDSTVAWAPSLGAADISAPGADFPSVVQSDAALVDLDVVMLEQNPWTITIQHTDSGFWDTDLVLSVAITSTGTAGTSGAFCTPKFSLGCFSPLTTAGAKTFLTGSRLWNDIKLQYQITGHSASKITAGHYATTVIYTLIN